MGTALPPSPKELGFRAGKRMMKDSMMMDQMQMHHITMYVFDVLVLIGLTTMIVLLSKIFKELRKR